MAKKPKVEIVEREPGLAGYLAQFRDEKVLLIACQKLKDVGYTRWDAHSPFPVHGVPQLRKFDVTIFRWLVFLGGISGAVLAILLQWYTNAVHYPFLVSGKPIFSLPANIPVTFELTVLFAGITAFLGMLLFNGLPLFFHPVFQSERFKKASVDSFFVFVDSRDEKFEEEGTRRFLESLGAIVVEEIPRPARSCYAMPSAIPLTLAVVVVVGLIPLGHTALARVKRSASPRMSIIRDMDKQPKYRPQSESKFFADGSAMRIPPFGAVARGESRRDTRFYEGRIGREWVTTFPMKVTPEFIKRGEERYRIYCATCHGLAGYGDGITAKRAQELQQPNWVPPASFHTDTVRSRPVGHIFNTITNGLRKMPSYGSQIPPEDRWAIIAYIRALQKSQYAEVEKLPPELANEIEKLGE